MYRSHSVSLMLSLITGVLVLVLLAVFTGSAVDAYDQERDSISILSNVRVSRDIILVREALRTELGVIDTAIAEPAPADFGTLSKLAILRHKSRTAISTVEEDLVHSKDSEVPRSFPRLLSRQVEDFEKTLYPAVVRALHEPGAKRPANLTTDPKASAMAILGVIDGEAAVLSRQIASAGPFMSELMRVSDIAWHIRVEAGEDRRALAGLITSPRAPSIHEREALAMALGRVSGPWQSIERSVQSMNYPRALVDAIQAANTLYFTKYVRERSSVISKRGRGEPLGITGPTWLGMTNPALNSLMQVSKAAMDIAEIHAHAHLREAQHKFVLALLIMASSIGLTSCAALFVLLRVIRPLNQLTGAITSNHDVALEGILARRRGDEIGQLARALQSFRRSVAQRQELEKAVSQNQAAKEAAEDASRMKSEFLANMSHELRTPLNAVIGFSELMIHETLGPLPARYEDYALTINSAGNHLLSLVSDVLDLAKIEAGRFEADFRRVDLKECIYECIPMVARRMEERGLTMSQRFAVTDVVIEADARAVKQILINLLSNAVKFSRNGSGISIMVDELGDQVSLSVADEGIGIPQELLSRIGRPFEQASNNPLLAREGTGLGLALVKALVKVHGGSVIVESEENVGTKITVRLPRDQHRKAGVSGPAEQAA